MTLSLVSTVTVGAGGAASITFTGIPQTATDLFLVASTHSTGFGSALYTTINGDTATNYNQNRMWGTGSGIQVQNNTGLNSFIWGAVNDNQASGIFGSWAMTLPNYALTGVKSGSLDTVTENNATAAEAGIYALKWAGTAAITSISLAPSSGTLAQYSTASLYTITKGSGGASVA